MPEGDEMVTRRYEFFAYVGEVNPEDGEAKCSNIKKCPDAVGGYIGAQMAGFDVEIEGELPEPPVLEIQREKGGRVKISVSGVAGSHWHIESATSLEGPWQPRGTALILPVDGVDHLIDEATLPAAYYRAVAD